MAAMKSVATLLRGRDAIKKSGMKPNVIQTLVDDIDRQIEELASQLALPLKTDPAPKSGKSGA